MLEATTERRETQERQAARRAGLVASAVYNVHRKKGKRPLGPDDFVGTGEEPVITDRKKGREALLAWARSINQGKKA